MAGVWAHCCLQQKFLFSLRSLPSARGAGRLAWSARLVPLITPPSRAKEVGPHEADANTFPSGGRAVSSQMISQSGLLFFSLSSLKVPVGRGPCAGAQVSARRRPCPAEVSFPPLGGKSQRLLPQVVTSHSAARGTRIPGWSHTYW